ncbi:hypothetical protein ACFFNY_24830 [Paenibacillus hodogayensis]|uniref:Uncharacterized protein n=1 Tax=Paenibacillus hodogayensis TaxID=279208 RepID=A0ABV5W2Q3_9BACL
MSKLDANGRWESKMALPEHIEQYEARGDKKATHPTTEELTMIRDYVLLPHMLTMVQRSIDDIKNSTNILKRLYLLSAEVVMSSINRDLYDLRRELSRRSIKIHGDEQVDMVVYYRYVCRGYEERIGIVREVMRSEISMRLAKYVSEVVHKIKG